MPEKRLQRTREAYQMRPLIVERFGRSIGCAHEWVMHMIRMPQGYDKPGITRCTKCGAYYVQTSA